MTAFPGTIFYPDVSNHNAGVSLAGALAVCAKATEGTGFADPDYAGFRQQAARHGAFFMAYHFLHGGAAAAQANFCFAHAGRAPLMVDVEPYPGIGSFPHVGDATEFIDAYRRAGGTTHLLYLPQWYWQQLGEPSLQPLASRGMVLVSSDYVPYGDQGPGWAGYGGMVPKVWQYSSTVNFGGDPDVDFNAHKGTVATLRAAATGAAAPAPQPPPQPQPAPAPTPPPPPVQEDDDMTFVFDTTPLEDGSQASVGLLPPFSTPSVTLLSPAPEGSEVTVSVEWVGHGADAKQIPLSYGTASTDGKDPDEVEVPAGVKKGRLTVVSGGGPHAPVTVRYNPPAASS